MLKKIKDLTKEEIRSICSKRIKSFECCFNCPLYYDDVGICLLDEDVYKFINKEIEVEENDVSNKK